MDDYTRQTKAWLDRRYRAQDRDGAYLAHQPIYGFARGVGDRRLADYARLCAVLNELARLRFESLLDAGAAEGFLAHLVRETFRVRVEACDLSSEACHRAGEIFGLTTRAADLHALPYADRAFDVVTACETLEHVSDVERAMGELLRVARRAVVVTVPRESRREVARHAGEPHAHLHVFRPQSFDYLRRRGLRVACRNIGTPVLDATTVIIEGVSSERLPRVLGRANELLRARNRSGLDPAFTDRLFRLDRQLGRLRLPGRGLVVVVEKPVARRVAKPKRITLDGVLAHSVDVHRLTEVGVGGGG